MFGWFRRNIRKVEVLGVGVEFHPPPTDPPQSPIPPPTDAAAATSGSDKAPRSAGRSTEPGYLNAQQQRVVRRLYRNPSYAGVVWVYELCCERPLAGGQCGHRYGANGPDIAGAGAGSGRRCPACQNGAAGSPLTQVADAAPGTSSSDSSS